MTAIAITTDRLSAIPGDIAQHATNMVQGAHAIGCLLNEAAEILGDDAAFGAWRQEHVTEPLGISKRTCARYRNVAARFTLESLPQQLSVSVLYMLASDSTDPSLQEAMLDRAARVGLGAVEANNMVSKVRKGSLTATEVKAETDRLAQAKAKAEGREEAPAGPVVLEGEVLPAATPQAAEAPIRVAEPRPVRDVEAEATEVAQNLRRRLKRESERNRAAFLYAIRRELENHGLLEIEAGLGVAVNGKLSITSK
jgi:hypothetical protein